MHEKIGKKDVSCTPYEVSRRTDSSVWICYQIQAKAEITIRRQKNTRHNFPSLSLEQISEQFHLAADSK